MTIIKSYTDLEQSKVLAKILPLESADMVYIWHATSDNHTFRFDNDMPPMVLKDVPIDEITADTLPCWSLAALLEILDYPQLSKDKLGSGKVGWMISVYPNDCRYDSCWHDNPVDACVEMIIRLNELNLL